MGLMENDQPSVALQALDIPVVATESCIKNQKRDFKKYVAFTTFCGGYANGKIYGSLISILHFPKFCIYQ